MSETTHISETVSAGQLRAFIERIERVEEEIKTLNGDKSEIYKELRGCGFDVKAVRQCVAARKLDSVEREERNAIFDLYWAALTGASRVHMHEGRDDAGSSSGRIAEFDSADAGSNPAPVTIDAETGEITEHEQPETAPQSSDGERPVAATGSEHHSTDHVSPPASQAAMGGGSANMENDNVDGGAARAGYGGQPLPLAGQIETRTKAEIVDENASLAAREGEKPLHSHSNPQPSPLSGADKPEAVRPPAVSGALSDDDVPVFLKKDQPRKTAKEYRPHCQRPEACGSSGLHHCYTCQKAIDAAAESEAA